MLMLLTAVHSTGSRCLKFQRRQSTAPKVSVEFGLQGVRVLLLLDALLVEQAV